MSADPNAVLVDEGRVVRLFGDRAGDRAERLREAPPPSNDVRFRLGDGVRADDVRARLDDVLLEGRLRGPTSTIATITGVLRHQVSEAQADQLTSIAASASRADAMLRDLLDFVRVGMGGAVITRRRIDLKVLCERVVDAIYSANPDRPMIFTSDRRVEGDWDPDAVETLLTKLVSNAIEHGDLRPAIQISVRSVRGAAVFEVWNAGAIVDREVWSHLFEPFVTGRATHGRASHGLGLGLYLGRELARAHGGRIDVQSAESEGTTFRVTLPSP